MSSNEFIHGHDGRRASSRVLRPPGGECSDIFGLGNPPSTPTPSASTVQRGPQTTQDRLFGSAPLTESVQTPQRASSEGFTPTTPSSVSRRQYESEVATQVPRAMPSVRSRHTPVAYRNPITGEGVEDMFPGPVIKPPEIVHRRRSSGRGVMSQVSGDNKSGKPEKENKAKAGEKEIEKKDDEEPDVPRVVPSIRVRNPPGGKSSGIFF